ncbi:MAG TPA: phage holin family protein [Vicinamibacteria bacterium]
MPPIQEPGLDVEEARIEPDATDIPADSAKASGAEADVSGQPLPSPVFELVRRVLVGMVQAIEDGADLLGASVREELARFRTDLVKSAVATLLLVGGSGLLTAGIALLMRAWIGTWPPVLLVLGGVYLAVGGWLFASTGQGHQGDRR